MEAIHSGWLVKSPTDRPWKILKPKWKKRYFVLCASQATATLPGHGPAVLDYYDGERQLHKRGTIDLGSCDEVQTNITSPPYEHVFNLRTKHKDRSRTYLFSAATEADMHRWVRFLCNVLHLTDSGPAADPNAVSSATDDRYVKVPRMTSALSLPSSTASHSSSPHLSLDEPDAPSTLTDKDRAEAYICLDECYSGRSPNSQKANGHTPASKLPMKHSPPRVEDLRPDRRRIEYANMPRSGSSDFPDGLVGSCAKERGIQSSRNVFPSSGRIVPSTGAGKRSDSNGAEALSSNRDPELPSYLNLDAVVGCLSQNAAATAKVYMNAAATPSSSKSLSSSLAGHTVSNGSQPGPGPGQKAVNTSSAGKVRNGHLSSSTVSVEGKMDPANPVDEEPVLISGRTQSFKRNIIHADVQLPIKKSSQGLDTSSSDEDTSDDDGNPSYRCYENEAVSSEPPPLPPPPKKLAHTQPKNAIQYLDLNLEESSGAEKSPMVNRSQHLPPPETDYNEIDWVKTKALLETKKDLESERRNSEKSAE